MTSAFIAMLLLLTVLGGYVGCAGLARLATAFDRLHSVPFVAVAAGVPLAIATVVADGLSDRAGKVIFLVVFMLVGGAALSHASGRAIAMHETNPEDP